jgi:hypothetical protein
MKTHTARAVIVLLTAASAFMAGAPGFEGADSEMGREEEASNCSSIRNFKG